MNYRIQVDTSLEKVLKKIPHKDAKKIRDHIRALADTPRPHGVEKLSGEENLYRIRCGDYRIIYSIHDHILLILIVSVGHRKEIYRK